MPNPEYRKMFEDLDAYYPKSDDLNKLATIMSGRAKFIDAENSFKLVDKSEKNTFQAIPAGYTYLTQFITHDISFDEASDRHIRKDRPWEIMAPEFIKELRNLRKPNFDLETVYGYANPVNHGEISRDELMQNHRLPLLRLGKTEGNDIDGGAAAFSYPNDLPRSLASVTAKVVDPRNDENLLLAQTQVAFIKFHNAIVVWLSESGDYKDESGKVKTKEVFDKARRITIRYYQTIILTDLLPRIVQESVLNDVVSKIIPGKVFYQPDMFIPLEFSTAAFRFGHSMIRNNYDLNAKINSSKEPARLRDLMMFTGRGEMDSEFIGSPRLKLPSIWIIDWNLFYEIDGAASNIAETIDTKISISLQRLRPEAANNTDGRASSLAALDLFRGRRFGLPAGQDVARKLGVISLRAEQITDLIMSRKIEQVEADEELQIKTRLCKVFGKKTPLWFYTLAEAEIYGNGKLGEVGSRIVAETVIQLLYYSEYSILRNEWNADEDFLLKSDRTFGMPEMLKFVQKANKDYGVILYPNMTKEFDELNPLGNS